MGVAVIVILVLVVVAAWVAGTYNSLVKNRNLTEEGFSTMDVYLKKRWDLIPNLVETVKGYAAHEENTFKELTALRAGSYDAMTPEQKIDVNQKLGATLTKIIAVAENYPDLKANTNFMSLQNDLSKIEEDIANARKYYNGTVRAYNNQVQMFPGNLVANIFGFKPAAMFEAAAAERENVKVSFTSNQNDQKTDATAN